MTIPLLCVTIIIVALVWRAARVLINCQWRRRQAQIMYDALSGLNRSQPPALIYGRLRAMDALAFKELLLESFGRWGHRIICNRCYTGDGGIDGQVVIEGREWLIQAKRYDATIRPKHVRWALR